MASEPMTDERWRELKNDLAEADDAWEPGECTEVRAEMDRLREEVGELKLDIGLWKIVVESKREKDKQRDQYVASIEADNAALKARLAEAERVMGEIKAATIVARITSCKIPASTENRIAQITRMCNTFLGIEKNIPQPPTAEGG